MKPKDEKTRGENVPEDIPGQLTFDLDAVEEYTRKVEKMDLPQDVELPEVPF